MSKRIGEKRTVYVQRIQVEGSGSFPHDMLRYDSCIPAHESEMHKLTMSFRDRPEYLQPRRVELIRYSTNGEQPTIDRWKSFGWNVVKISSLW